MMIRFLTFTTYHDCCNPRQRKILGKVRRRIKERLSEDEERSGLANLDYHVDAILALTYIQSKNASDLERLDVGQFIDHHMASLMRLNITQASARGYVYPDTRSRVILNVTAIVDPALLRLGSLNERVAVCATPTEIPNISFVRLYFHARLANVIVSPAYVKRLYGPDVSLCAGCFARRPDMPFCGGCGVQCYCDRACQKLAWPIHKLVCSREYDRGKSGPPRTPEQRWECFQKHKQMQREARELAQARVGDGCSESDDENDDDDDAETVD